MLTRLSKQHPGQDHFFFEQVTFASPPSLSLSKPKNCSLVADMIWSAVRGAKMPEYAELWLILRLLKRDIGSLRDMMRPSRRRFSASLHQPAATSGPETVREIDMLPNTETDIFELNAHAWSWRVFGRSEMVIFIDEPAMEA